MKNLENLTNLSPYGIPIFHFKSKFFIGINLSIYLNKKPRESHDTLPLP